MYDYQYSFTDEVHCYAFSGIPLKLTLTPSYFITPDLNANLNILCIDLVRTGSKEHFRVGETVCFILNDFIENNRDKALGYYPSSTDNKEDARVCLFNKWANCFVPGDDITSYKSILNFPAENGEEKEELTLQLFTHKEYPNDVQLLEELNNFSKLISNK